MEEIIREFRKWKNGKDDGYQLDEIGEFVNSLSRGDLLMIFEMLEQQYGNQIHRKENK